MFYHCFCFSTCIDLYIYIRVYTYIVLYLCYCLKYYTKFWKKKTVNVWFYRYFYFHKIHVLYKFKPTTKSPRHHSQLCSPYLVEFIIRVGYALLGYRQTLSPSQTRSFTSNSSSNYCTIDTREVLHHQLGARTTYSTWKVL